MVLGQRIGGLDGGNGLGDEPSKTRHKMLAQRYLD